MQYKMEQSFSNSDADAVIALLPKELRDSSAALSQRERQFLALTAQGLPYRAIARKLHVTTSTVAFHLEQIAKKLNITRAAGDRCKYIWRLTADEIDNPVLQKLLAPLKRSPVAKTEVARQSDVVLLILQGASFKRAARELGIAPRTVAFHLYQAEARLALISGGRITSHQQIPYYVRTQTHAMTADGP